MGEVRLFLLGANLWYVLDAGLMSSMINLLVIDCYDHAPFLIAGHPRGAMFGVKGNIALASILFCVQHVIKPEDWCPNPRENRLLEFDWRHRSDDGPEHVANEFIPVLPELPLRPVVCTLWTDCGGSFDPESREDALCRRGSLRMVLLVAVRVVHLHPLVHAEGRDNS